MKNQFERTEKIIGQKSLEKLKNSHVAIFGVGGVGGFATEAIARSGIGKIDIFDFDIVDITNLNRQIIATHKSIGKKKVDVLKERILDINPECQVNSFDVFYSENNAKEFPLSKYDYIIDAIDSVDSKVFLVKTATESGVNIISSMGAGNKLATTKFEVSDISKTSVCPLARVVRKKLRDIGINKLKVVYSKEEPVPTVKSNDGKRSPGSMPYVPGIAGLIIAGEVIQDIINKEQEWKIQ